MSYILDALKKSDQERKRGDVPNLQTIHIPINAEPQPPFILYGFIFLLLIALAFVVGLLVSGSQDEDIQVVEENNMLESQAITKNIKASSLSRHEDINKPVVEKKPVEIAGQPTEKVSKETPQINLKSEKEVLSSKVRGQVAIKDESRAVNVMNLNDVPYLDEMPDYRQQSVPEMNFAGHVYSSRPASRSVIINGSVMSEGDVVVQGINVVEITPSGVVFSLHDELFRMDILQDWSFD